MKRLLQKTFRPEFLNRIDAIVFYRKLNEQDVKKIAEIQLQVLVNRLLEKHITLTIDDKVMPFLAKEGYSPEFGARPLKRVIQQYIMVPISQFLLKHPEKKNLAATLKDKNVIIQ